MRDALGVIVFFLFILAMFAMFGKGIDVTVNDKHYRFAIQEAK